MYRLLFNHQLLHEFFAVFRLWLHRTRSLLPRNCDTALATLAAHKIFTAFPICSHSLSLSLFVSVSLLMIAILNKTYGLIYRFYIWPDTAHIFVKNTYDKRGNQHQNSFREWLCFGFVFKSDKCMALVKKLAGRFFFSLRNILMFFSSFYCSCCCCSL